MQELEKNIMQIERPRALMNAAKSVAISQSNSQTEMTEEGLKTLLNEEELCENFRLHARWQYSAEHHIKILAQLINQARMISRKGEV